MRYQDFIGELRELLAQVDAFQRANTKHTSPEFREWRHRVESLVAEATALGYRLPGTFSSSDRAYCAMFAYATDQDERDAFRRDLNDTAIEIRFLIGSFEKYGQPPLDGSGRSSPDGPTAPDEVTLAWLFAHVPVRLWWSTATAAIVLVLLGAGFGQTDAFRSVLEFLRRVVGWE